MGKRKRHDADVCDVCYPYPVNHDDRLIAAKIGVGRVGRVGMITVCGPHESALALA